MSCKTVGLVRHALASQNPLRHSTWNVQRDLETIPNRTAHAPPDLGESRLSSP